MLREISAGIIIYRKTEDGPKFLLLYHGRGYWNFPKGKIESEEKSFQAAVRETKEETGLNRNDLKFVNNFKVSEKFSFWRRINEKNVRVFKIVIFYLAQTDKKIVLISNKKEGQPHEGFAWFTYKEAIKILLKHKDSQKVLTQAHDFLLK
ncbi:MAG: NUDIX domain-containing protein [Patescibacteria group bacterium]